MEEEHTVTGEEENDGLEVGIDRIVSFSDAVFAVAITIMVLAIAVPQISSTVADTELPHELIDLIPKFITFFVSFAIVGMFWVLHHNIFRYIKRSDTGLPWMNLLLLMFVALQPFSTGLMSEYTSSRAAVIFYATNMCLTALALSLIWWYATRKRRLVAHDFDMGLRDHILLNYLNVSLVFLVSIGVAYINVQAAQYVWLLILVNAFLLERVRRKQRKRA